MQYDPGVVKDGEGVGGLVGCLLGQLVFYPQWWECANQRVKSHMLRGYGKQFPWQQGLTEVFISS